MPVTPFHFGPGILLKACAPRAVSLTAFVTSQVAIDIESGYHLLRHDWPVHREVHSLPVAGVVGVLTGTAVWIVGRKLRASNEAMIQSEVALLPAHVGGLVGGLSHPLLDAVMHADLRPFWPFSTANPLLAVISLGYLHLLCFASGVVGAVVLVIRTRLPTKGGGLGPRAFATPRCVRGLAAIHLPVLDIYVADGRASLSGVMGLLWLLVRWLLVVAACWAGFYAAFIPGAVVYGALRDWCPWGGPEFVAALQRGESVTCPMPAWIDGGVRALFSSLAAVAVVWLGTVTAPTRRVWFPWAVYLSGATITVYWTLRLFSPSADIGSAQLPFRPCVVLSSAGSPRRHSRVECGELLARPTHIFRDNRGRGLEPWIGVGAEEKRGNF